MTHQVKDACQALGLTLHDHLIIGRRASSAFGRRLSLGQSRPRSGSAPGCRNAKVRNQPQLDPAVQMPPDGGFVTGHRQGLAKAFDGAGRLSSARSGAIAASSCTTLAARSSDRARLAGAAAPEPSENPASTMRSLRNCAGGDQLRQIGQIVAARWRPASTCRPRTGRSATAGRPRPSGSNQPLEVGQGHVLSRALDRVDQAQPVLGHRSGAWQSGRCNRLASDHLLRDGCCAETPGIRGSSAAERRLGVRSSDGQGQRVVLGLDGKRGRQQRKAAAVGQGDARGPGRILARPVIAMAQGSRRDRLGQTGPGRDAGRRWRPVSPSRADRASCMSSARVAARAGRSGMSGPPICRPVRHLSCQDALPGSIVEISGVGLSGATMAAKASIARA
jgi:hypothetical protein